MEIQNIFKTKIKFGDFRIVFSASCAPLWSSLALLICIIELTTNKHVDEAKLCLGGLCLASISLRSVTGWRG